MEVLGQLGYRGVLTTRVALLIVSQSQKGSLGETGMNTHEVEGILRGRPHVALSVDGVWDKQAIIT